VGGGKRPTAIQAGVYAGTLHYLRAAAAANTTDGQKVVAKMKEMPSKDPLFGEVISARTAVTSTICIFSR
jgi:branched-chain amino acid transport system substrate-binding protein